VVEVLAHELLLVFLHLDPVDGWRASEALDDIDPFGKGVVELRAHNAEVILYHVTRSGREAVILREGLRPDVMDLRWERPKGRRALFLWGPCSLPTRQPTRVSPSLEVWMEQSSAFVSHAAGSVLTRHSSPRTNPRIATCASDAYRLSG